jgi:hypothetical protein
MTMFKMQPLAPETEMRLIREKFNEVEAWLKLVHKDASLFLDQLAWIEHRLPHIDVKIRNDDEEESFALNFLTAGQLQAALTLPRLGPSPEEEFREFFNKPDGDESGKN